MFELLLSSLATSVIPNESLTLLAGDANYGYYGTSNLLPNTAQLVSLVGTPDGQGNVVTPVWYKFALNGKTLFIPQKPLYIYSTWTKLNDLGLVSGKQFTYGGRTFICRLMTGANMNPSTVAASGSTVSPDGSQNSEWSKLMYALHTSHPASAPAWANLSNTDLQVGGSTNTASWCQETRSSNTAQALHRGYTTVESFNYNTKTSGSPSMNWRPILELVS